MQGAGRQFPLDRHHRNEGRTQAGLNCILDRLKGIELHLDAETLHIQTGSAEQLIHHLSGCGLRIEADESQPIEIVLGEFHRRASGCFTGSTSASSSLA